MDTLRELLSELVAIDSASARTNLPMIEALERHLRRLGFTSRRLAYRDDGGVEKINLVALTAESEPPVLALVGHTDTVPWDPAWTNALEVKERDGKLFGRGCCDTKGFIACALDAAARADRSRLAHPLAMIFTADEEVGCAGAKELARGGAVRPRYAIVGEPTRLVPIRAHKGYSLARIEVAGREGHSAYPSSGASAILAAGEMITRIETLMRSLSREQHADFEPPFTTFNIGRIQGGTAANIIAGQCSFTLEWRSIPGQEAHVVVELVGAAARDVSERRGVRVSVYEERSDKPFETAPTSPLVRFLEERTGNRAVTVSFGTEAPALTEMGAEAVVFGPGDIQVAHRTDEFVPISDLERCRDALVGAIERFCS